MKRLLTVLLVMAVTTAMAGCKCFGWKGCRHGYRTGCSSCTPAPSLYDPGLAPPTIDYSTPTDLQETYSIPQ